MQLTVEFGNSIGFTELITYWYSFCSFNKESAEPAEQEDTKNFSEHPDFNKLNGSTNNNKRSAEGPLSELRSNKMFKESVINGIKKYMQEKTPSNDTSDENSGVITNT